MYNRVFKNNQITYGVPFQVKIPINMQEKSIAKDSGEDEGFEESRNKPESPEALLQKAREEASNIIKEAEYEAAGMLEQAEKKARAKAASIEEEAWQKGYGEGLEAAKREYEELIIQAEAEKTGAQEEHERVLAGMEAEIVELAVELARKVVAKELSTDRESIIHMAAQALDKCSSKSGAVLKVSKEDYDYVIENKDMLTGMVEASDGIEIRKDQSLKKGACIVETPFGNIDASAATKLQKIEEAFRKLLES